MRAAVTPRLATMVVALGLLTSLAAATPVLAASITVTSLADTAADDGQCTLREAITAANTDTASGAIAGECAAGSGADFISFGVGVAGTITLGSALPAITSDLSVDGDGSITVSGAGAVRVFLITGSTVTLSGLTITGGTGNLGGGIRSDAGTMTVTNSTISGNTSTVGGGGGIVIAGGTMTVTNSTISGNSGAGAGGGILNAGVGTMTVANSTISGNTSGNGLGGGIANAGTLTVINSTISGNSSTIAGGGIFALVTETLVNSIVAGNTAPIGPDIEAVAETITTSVIGVPSGMTLADILDPAGLADNGGPTQTIALALVAGNPAIDLGTSATCAAAPVNALDQRGMPRPAACDIGAYEAQPPTVAAQANVSAAATSAAGAVVSYTAPAGTDEQGGTATVACLPASGSTFAVGSTTVTCTATDAVGHTGSGTFSVNVSPLVPTLSPTTSATPRPTASPALLPNTASGSGIAATPRLPAVLALIGLLSIVALGRRVKASREGRLRS